MMNKEKILDRFERDIERAMLRAIEAGGTVIDVLEMGWITGLASAGEFVRGGADPEKLKEELAERLAEAGKENEEEGAAE